LLLWLAALIANPVGIWISGEALFPALATLAVATQFLAVLAALSSDQPVRRLAALGLTIAALTWTAELIGSRTGFPFGRYHYTSLLQPQVAGVPLLIPLAWTMMLLPAWAVASSLLERFAPDKFPPNLLLHAILTGLVFTAWDLYLDPFMVSHRIWVWDQPGVYFGIPLVNFLGWWLTAAAVVLLVRTLIPDFKLAKRTQKRLILVYVLTWLFQAVGSGLFWGQPGPALAGFVGMGVFALPAVGDSLRSVAKHVLNREAVKLAGKES
jgi:putative membrane protein